MKLLYSLFLILVSHSLFADETGYEVEIIIFEDLSNPYINSESWPQITDTTDILEENNSAYAQKINTGGNDNNTNNIFSMMPAENYRLNNHAKKITDNQNYRVLYHSAWKQIGLDRKNAIPFHINSKQYNLINNIENQNGQVSTISNPSDNHENRSSINGTVTLILSRYLHFNTDLIYSQLKENESHMINVGSSSEAASSAAAYSLYSIKSERRMRSRETHYIDHPLVGILVLATPFTITNNPATEIPATTQNTINATP